MNIAPQPTYEELLYVFKGILGQALEHGAITPACLAFELALIKAVGDLARAVRDGDDTSAFARVACSTFAKYAFDHEAMNPPIN